MVGAERDDMILLRMPRPNAQFEQKLARRENQAYHL